MISNTQITAQPECAYSVLECDEKQRESERGIFLQRAGILKYRNLQYADCCSRKGYE